MSRISERESRYSVRDRGYGDEVARYRSRQRAVRHAERLADGEVYSIVVSGTYQSTTRVYPTVGETFSR